MKNGNEKMIVQLVVRITAIFGVTADGTASFGPRLCSKLVHN